MKKNIPHLISERLNQLTYCYIKFLRYNVYLIKYLLIKPIFSTFPIRYLYIQSIYNAMQH